MNKKIFTLVAALGVAASSFTAGAQATPSAKDFVSGQYYQIGVTADGTIAGQTLVGFEAGTSTAFSGTSAGAGTNKDVLLLGVDAEKTDSVVLGSTAGTAAITLANDYYYWKVEEVTNASGKAYVFTNKKTQQKLSFAKPGTNTISSAIVSTASTAIDNWFMGADGIEKASNISVGAVAANVTAIADMKHVAAKADLVIVERKAGSNYQYILAVKNGTATPTQAAFGGTAAPAEVAVAKVNFFLVQPDAAALNLTELNAKKGGEGFELAFTPDADSKNVFAGKTLTAFAPFSVQVEGGSAKAAATYAVGSESTKTTLKAAQNGGDAGSDAKEIQVSSTDIVNTNAPAGATSVFIKVGEVTNGANKKVAMYAVVDTVYVNGTKTYMIGQDSLRFSQSKANSGFSEILAAPDRDLASYLFTVKQDYATDNLELSVAGTPVAKAEDVTYWKDDSKKEFATVPASNHEFRVYVAQFASAKELVVGDDDTQEAKEAIDAALALSKITFEKGTAVDNLNTKVAYSVQPAKDKKGTGKYFVAGTAYADKDKLTATSVSDYIPATQYGLIFKGGNTYKLYNRETGATLVEGVVYDIDAANGIYRFGTSDVALTAMPNVKGKNVGYKEFSASDVKNKSIALKLNTFGSNPVYLALKGAKDSLVVASEDADSKIEFKLVANESKAFGDADNDSLKRTSYALKSGDLYLAYDYNLQSYKLSKLLNGGNKVTSGAAVNEATPTPEAANDTVFVYFQNIGKDTYALVPEMVYTATDANSFAANKGFYKNSEAWTTVAGVRKELGVYANKLVVNSNGTVKNVDFGDSMNSAFTIEDGTPDYNKDIQKSAHKVISLFTDKAMSLTITPDNFAAMKREGQLKSEYTDENLKMFVDTATMADVNKPLYYIATSQNVAAECAAKGELNYLVSLEDSSKVEGYTNVEKLPLVGYIHGTVDADTITLFKNHNVKADTVVYKNNHANEANWALTANENGSVSLENQKSGKFVAFHNDVLVMVGSLDEAAQFTMTATEAPVANEAIGTSAVKVSTIEGNVVIAGAQGKKVTISNVLGQTIAQTVLSSDNETIAAPAGVAVVAVEGEAAVKAIVK